jgi:geranylgeranyl pyrophosphate synthase
LAVLAERRTAEGACLLKPLLLRLAFEASGGHFTESILPACCAVEILNISSYQANVALDGKLGFGSAAGRSWQFLASMLSRECAARALADATDNLPGSLAVNAQLLLSECNRAICLGQQIDGCVLTTASFDVSTDFAAYEKIYVQRCTLLSGVFSAGTAALGATLAEATHATVQVLYDFGRCFGIALHIVNDIGDCIIGNFAGGGSLKAPTDQFSDLRLGKLTLPLMYALRAGTPDIRLLLFGAVGRKQLEPEEELSICRALHQTGAFHYAKHLAKGYMNRAKQALWQLPRSDARTLLSTMVSQVRSNKYFAALRALTGTECAVGRHTENTL